MLKVTESAKQLLKEILETHSDDPNKVILRFTLKPPGQLGLVLDTEQKGDQVIEHEGKKVLLVAPQLMPAIKGITLDVEVTADGPKLVVHKEEAE